MPITVSTVLLPAPPCVSVSPHGISGPRHTGAISAASSVLSQRELLSRRLAAQNITGLTGRVGDVAATVRQLFATQAQDFAQSLWGIGLRTPGAHRSDVLRAMTEGSIDRSSSLRGTLMMVAAEDLCGILSLTAERTIASTRTRRRQLELDEATMTRAPPDHRNSSRRAALPGSRGRAAHARGCWDPDRQAVRVPHPLAARRAWDRVLGTAKRIPAGHGAGGRVDRPHTGVRTRRAARQVRDPLFRRARTGDRRRSRLVAATDVGRRTARHHCRQRRPLRSHGGRNEPLDDDRFDRCAIATESPGTTGIRRVPARVLRPIRSGRVGVFRAPRAGSQRDLPPHYRGGGQSHRHLAPNSRERDDGSRARAVRRPRIASIPLIRGGGGEVSRVQRALPAECLLSRTPLRYRDTTALRLGDRVASRTAGTPVTSASVEPLSTDRDCPWRDPPNRGPRPR